MVQDLHSIELRWAEMQSRTEKLWMVFWCAEDGASSRLHVCVWGIVTAVLGCALVSLVILAPLLVPCIVFSCSSRARSGHLRACGLWCVRPLPCCLSIYASII